MTEHAADTLDAARGYLARGFAPIPVPRGSKRAVLEGWPELRLTADDLPAHFGNGANIGLLLGPASGDLIDVDIDCDDALDLADEILPPTEAVTGRPSRPRSHRWYIAVGAKTQQHRDPKTREMIVEMRGAGVMTLVGPSVHPDGEVYDRLVGQPLVIDADLLAAKVRELEDAVLLRRYGEIPTRRKSSTPTTPNGTAPTAPRSDADTLRRASKYLAAMPAAISGQGGHSATYAAAVALVHGFELGADDALRLLVDEFNGRCEPPWTISELEHKIEDACTRDHDRPRGWLLDTPLPDTRRRAPAPARTRAEHRIEGIDDGADDGRRRDRPSAADTLVALAGEHFRLGRDDEGGRFAVHRDGPALAIPLRSQQMRSMLARLHRDEVGKVPNANALADAICALEADADDADPEPVAIRVGQQGESIVLDLGDATGRAVVISATGWRVVERAPCLFRRTRLTAPMPTPERGGDLRDLRDLLNVARDEWPLLIGFLIAAMVPGIPHPIALLSGEQGTGKSTVARMLVALVDASTVPLRSEPRSLDDWAVACSGSWAVVLDNLSGIAPWLADALCRASTGDGLVKRSLYTDAELAVLRFRRVVLLTTIDAGAMRGDLGDRLLLLDLERIPDDRRRTEQEIIAAFERRLPSLLGALLAATAKTLAALPSVRLATLPRMADFAKVLAAADIAVPELTEGKALERFLAQRDRIAATVVEGDPFADAVMAFAKARGEWSGTADELLVALDDGAERDRPRGWPDTAQKVGGRLSRVTPALLACGIIVERDREPDRTRRKIIRLRANGEVAP